MKLEQFRLGERSASNDRAIKISKNGELYKVQFVLEKDCTKDSVVFGDDPVENMNLELFITMFDNKGFKEFIEKGGSVLKASGTNIPVLENISNHNGRIRLLKEKSLITYLGKLKLGKPRYNGWDQERDIERVQDVLKDNGIDTSINLGEKFLDNNTKNEENTSGEQRTSNEQD